MVRLHNIRGLEQAAPTEFVRAAGDGKPELRRGIALVLHAIPKGDDGFARLSTDTNPPRKPARDERFDPGSTSRTLAPTESFEAFQLDLRDWYADLAPGGYEFQVKFGADSGLGEGVTDRLEFWIVEPEKTGQ